MIVYSSKYRSIQKEVLDDLNLGGTELRGMLSDLKKVNRLLGGNRVTIRGISYLLKNKPVNGPITILDVGCGDGEQLRRVADFGKRNQLELKLIGVDANPNILETAKDRSNDYPEITYRKLDIFQLDQTDIVYDIVLCTLFLHHFSGNEIATILKTLTKNAKVGVVINDLHRSRWAFWLFRLFSTFYLKSAIAKHDGLVSVARGFKRKELVSYTGLVSETSVRTEWKWAFRWQCILTKRNELSREETASSVSEYEPLNT